LIANGYRREQQSPRVLTEGGCESERHPD